MNARTIPIAIVCAILLASTSARAIGESDTQQQPEPEPQAQVPEPQKPEPQKPIQQAQPEVQAPVVTVVEPKPKPDLLPPLGRAAPPTAAGTTKLPVDIRPGVEIIAQYMYLTTWDQTTGKSDWFHDIELVRGHASIGATYRFSDARAVFEAVRSSSEGALIGVAGDSLVLRVREAWVGFHYPEHETEGWRTEMRAGVVPTLTVPELEGTWMLRSVTPDPLETTGLLTPADLGGTVRLGFPSGFGHVDVGMFDGEGYTNRELNRGKNLELAATVHPLATQHMKPLAVFGSMVLGSSGTGLAQSNRATGAVLWQGRRVRAGASITYAWGLGDDGGRTGYLFDAFARVEPIDRLIFGARTFYWRRDTRPTSEDSIAYVVGAVGYRFFDPLEVFAAVDRTMPTTLAETALPGTNNISLRVIAHVAF
jgi:hypothetical protein